VLTNSGSISATGTGVDSVVHGVWSPFGGIVQNTGQIVAVDANPGVQSVALQFGGGPTISVDNHGTITGEIAILDTYTWDGGSQFNQIGNEGTINGRIELNPGSGGSAIIRWTIANSGTINGDVDLGPGNDSFFGENGVQNGLVSGGLGNDLLRGGASRDSLQGNQGDDTLHGGDGDDIVVGGKDDDQQFGEGGDDIVWGNLGNDTLDGGDGNDQVRGGQGDDVVRGGAGNDYVSGDRGADTITGGAGADLFHSFSGAGIDRVLDFSVTEGDRVMLDPGTTYSVSQVGADTVVDMGNGDQVILVGVSMSSLTAGSIFLG
jgi:Ca2+-binding RTX toxin-like protein